MTYAIETSKFDAARPFAVVIVETNYLNRCKGRYATRAQAAARKRELEKKA